MLEGNTQISNQEKPSFGMELVGISFNPSGDPQVTKVKQLCAQLADIVNDSKDIQEQPRYLFNLIKGKALGEILNAQMNIVKLLTLK